MFSITIVEKVRVIAPASPTTSRSINTVYLKIYLYIYIGQKIEKETNFEFFNPNLSKYNKFSNFEVDHFRQYGGPTKQHPPSSP